jgi:RecA/RadA recombinase
VASQRDEESDPVLADMRATIARKARELDELQEIAREQAGEAATSAWMQLEGLREELRIVAATRVPTGIPTLDKATKGGLPGGTVTLLVGPEGSCKTALAVQLGIGRARKLGKVCYGYMPDQGGAQPLARLAETFGDVAENDVAFRKFVTEIGPFFRVFDERRAGVTLETFRTAVLDAKDVGAVIIDTPQTVAVDDEEDERRILDRCMDVAREIASKLTTQVLVPSHANRASTAARKKEDRNMERSAALGSAKLGHRSQLVMFMEKIEADDESTQIDTLTTKCSYGRSGMRFRLVLNDSTWVLAEVDYAAVDPVADLAREENRRGEKKATEQRAHRQAILAIVDGAPANIGVSLTRIRSTWGGRVADLGGVMRLLVEDGILETHLGPRPPTGGRQPLFYHRKEGEK